MKVTKYGHACLFVEKNDQTLVIDPGCFTKLPKSIPNNVVAVIITEEHADHYDLPNLELLLEVNPEAIVYTTSVVSNILKAINISAVAIEGRSTKNAGDFTLHFSETPHAVVHKTSPCQSLSVQVDDSIYYPSDSYQTITGKVSLLALPVSGPWYKVTESIDFVNSIDSRKILPTHNALNSPVGNMVAQNHIKAHLEENGREWVDLKDGESLEL